MIIADRIAKDIIKNSYFQSLFKICLEHSYYQILSAKVSSDFNENIRRTNPEYTARSESDLKQELISENFRLLEDFVTNIYKNFIKSIVGNFLHQTECYF